MGFSWRIAGTAGLIWHAAGVVGAAGAEPLRISYFVWVGNGPFFVAEEKGFFAEEGVDVELINIEDHAAAFAALSAGQLHGVQGAFQDAPAFSAPGEAPLVCVFVPNESRGADGVVASADIETVPELKGETVAVHRDGLPGFYLSLLLADAGIDEADLEIVDLTAEDAARAFLLQEVDAAVTYEPYLTEAEQAKHGHLLTDTSTQPGRVFDCVMTKRDILEARLNDFRALAQAWDQAIDYVEAHPEDANEIMARELGGWLQDPAFFAEIVDGVQFYDAEANQEFFGTSKQPGPIYEAMELAIDVLSDRGEVDADASAGNFIAHGIWEK